MQCVCVCVGSCLCKVCMFPHIFANVCTSLSQNICVCVCVCVSVLACLHNHVCIFIDFRVYVFLSTDVHFSECVYVRECVFTNISPCVCRCVCESERVPERGWFSMCAVSVMCV